MTAVWTPAEETAFVEFLVENKSAAGDNGNFKPATYQQALARIAPLRERGAVKTVKGLRNKWTAFKKIYRIIRAIQLVSGWVWDDTTGASITIDTASSWDDYVRKHPEAKPYRNKGWKYFSNVAIIMPSTAPGCNVFHPTATVDNGSVDSSASSPAPDTSIPMSTDNDESSDHDEPTQSAAPSKQAHVPATAANPAAKRVRSSQGAAALQSMTETLAGFNAAFTAALAPPASAIAPSPVRRTNAIAAVQRLEADWLNITERVKLIDFLRDDRTAADVYSALVEPDVGKEWVRIQLEKLGVLVF